MLPCSVRETDFYSRLFLRGQDHRPYEGYYTSLGAIRPLLASIAWKQHVTGFYINSACNYNAVRISYFSTTCESVTPFVKTEIGRIGLTVLKDEKPESARVSEVYGGEEVRFRRYLCCYTAIGWDLIEANLLHARCLLATFRWQVMRARQSYRDHFRTSFEKLSPMYRSMSDAEQEQFWRDLEHWPGPSKVDWAHFLVNMVLACDWPGTMSRQQFPMPQAPLSITIINQCVAQQGFQIALDWTANTV